MFKNDGCRLVWEYDGEKLWIEAWGENSLRVRAARRPKIDGSEDWALLKAEACDVAITIEEEEASLRNGNIKAVVEKSGKLSFYNSENKLLLEEYVRMPAAPGHYSSLLKIPARDFAAGRGDDYSLTARFEPSKGEKMFGMGQYQNDILDLKGSTLELAQRNSQASVPFVVSSLGYGFLWNNPAIGRASFATNITEWSAVSTKQMDYWITAGNSPRQILSQYMEATGKPPMMPDYAMGFWQSKLRYETQEELLGIAREYKKRGLPLAAIVIDYFHWTNQGEWKFDPDYWPDPQAMVDELRELGTEPIVSVWPTVDTRSENYQEMLEKGYLVKTNRGVRTQMQFLGEESFYDATNPEARAYLWNKIKDGYGKYGIKSFWLDVAEPEYTEYDFENYRYSLGDNVQVGNIYPLCYAQNFYEGLKESGVEKPLSLIRCAWAGSQRFGTLVWSGDIHTSFRSMRCQIAAGLNMAMAGIPWWTTDIGGFDGGNGADAEFRECLVRWFEYAAFCPVMRMHGARLPYKKPLSEKLGGGLCESGSDNEVWSFGERAYDIFKKYMAIREKLRPYVKELMEKAHLCGEPPMRPLFYDFSKDGRACEISDEFMFGEKLLVAPITEMDARSREVYLPLGAAWQDAWSGEKFEGGSTIKAEAPLDKIPLYFRDGAVLPLFE